MPSVPTDGPKQEPAVPYSAMQRSAAIDGLGVGVTAIGCGRLLQRGRNPHQYGTRSQYGDGEDSLIPTDLRSPEQNVAASAHKDARACITPDIVHDVLSKS